MKKGYLSIYLIFFEFLHQNFVDFLMYILYMFY